MWTGEKGGKKSEAPLADSMKQRWGEFLMLHFNVKRQLVLAGVLTLIATPLAAQNTEYRCEYTHRESCGPNGCEEIPTEDAYLLVPELSVLRTAGSSLLTTDVVIRRCDSQGCTPVTVTSSTSGAFLNVWRLAPGGYMLKFANWETDDALLGPAGEFVEIATLWLDTFVSYGRCPFGDGELAPEREATAERIDPLTQFEDTERTVYRLYRSSVAIRDARIHVATFDVETGERYNRENCEIARDLFVGQFGVNVRYWWF